MKTKLKQTKKRPPRITKAKKQTRLSVVSVRISDEEKERIDEIMMTNNIKRYSDVMRMAIQLIQVPNNANGQQTSIFH